MKTVLTSGTSARAQNQGGGFTPPPGTNAATGAPLAGTSISNRAYLTFESEGQPVRLDSNTVSVAVSGVPAVSLVPSLERNVAPGAPGAPVSLAHRLTNTGNIATAYTLQIASLSGDSYDLDNLQIALDVNSNGVFDAGETLLTPGTPVFLNPGQFADIVLFGSVPANTSPTAISRTRLTATVSGPARRAPTFRPFRLRLSTL